MKTWKILPILIHFAQFFRGLENTAKFDKFYQILNLEDMYFQISLFLQIFFNDFKNIVKSGDNFFHVNILMQKCWLTHYCLEYKALHLYMNNKFELLIHGSVLLGIARHKFSLFSNFPFLSHYISKQKVEIVYRKRCTVASTITTI